MDKEIEDRIFAAANALYEEGGRQSFPQVDVVRKAVRANMNDVCTAMKTWRNLQKIQPAPAVLIQVPQAIEEASRVLLGSLWQNAQELSNNALRSAQAGWEVARLEADALSKEVADDYEVKILEVEAAQREITRLQASATKSASELEAMRGELAAAKADRVSALAVADDLQAKLTQAVTDADALKNQLTDAQALIQRQVLELTQVHERLNAQEKQSKQAGTGHAAELDRLNTLLNDERKRHADAVAQQRDELQEQAKNAATARDALNKEIATAKADAVAAKQAQSQHEASAQKRVNEAETKVSEAERATRAAREDAAQLYGKVEVMQKQTTELLAIIGRWKVPMAGDKAAPDQAGQAPAAASIPIDFDPSSAMPEAQA
jgi:chromosome segregation ATPase